MQSYLPAQSTQRLPALFGVKTGKSFESEREILYQVLFDMRQDVTELKKLVHEIMSERGAVPPMSVRFIRRSGSSPYALSACHHSSGQAQLSR